MRRAQINSEILKWILMLIIFAVIIVIIIFLQSGLPEAVTDILKKVGEVI